MKLSARAKSALVVLARGGYWQRARRRNTTYCYWTLFDAEGRVVSGQGRKTYEELLPALSIEVGADTSGRLFPSMPIPARPAGAQRTHRASERVTLGTCAPPAMAVEIDRLLEQFV